MPSLEERLAALDKKSKNKSQTEFKLQKTLKRKKIAAERGKLSEQKRSKNAPAEFHALTPVGLPTHSILDKRRGNEVKSHNDPRFRERHEEKPSKAKMHSYDPRYAFLEEMLREELDGFHKRYAALSHGDEEKFELKRQIDRHETRLREIQGNKMKYEIEKEYYEKQASVIEKTGQKAHMLTKSRLESLLKKRQFEEMRSEGKLEKYMKKKRKRNFAKDVKKMRPEGKPAKRQRVGEE